MKGKKTTHLLLPLALLSASAGCSTVRELNEPFSIGENMAAAVPGRELAPAKTAAPARDETVRKRDDFIEVDDEEGIRKTWPMALFIGLLALAAAVF